MRGDVAARAGARVAVEPMQDFLRRRGEPRQTGLSGRLRPNNPAYTPRRADGAAEGDVGIEARIVHVDRDLDRAQIGDLSEPVSVVCVDQEEPAVLQAF